MQLECLGNFCSSQFGVEVVFDLSWESVNAMWFIKKNSEHVCRFWFLGAIAGQTFGDDMLLIALDDHKAVAFALTVVQLIILSRRALDVVRFLVTHVMDCPGHKKIYCKSTENE